MVPLIGDKKGITTWTLFPLGFFLVATVLTFLMGTVEAANIANPVLMQQKNVGTLSVKKTTPPIYRYTANTVQNASKQGKVNAAKIFWDCRGTGCTTSGPWPQPSVRACQNLATLVGPIKSFGRSGHYLNAKDIKQCNQLRTLSANPQKSAGLRREVQTTPVVKVKDVRNKSRAFFNRLPVDKVTKTQLATGKQLEYQVLTNAFSGNSGRMERRSWRGQILLPDLSNSGRKKVIHTQSKTGSGSRARKQVMWVIENPDKSLSKQILNSAGQLAGNITFTKDGSVRIGLDLNGDEVADLYELQVSDGEHSILFSPAGQVAWERFMNGGANPLCAPGASSAGGGFAGGMISGTDKTALQMVCGRSSGSQGGGGSAGGSSRGGGLSGNPGGRTMDAMCKGALSQHRSVPGNPGMAMGDPSDREFSWSRAGHKLLSSLLIAIIPGASLVDDANTVVHADDNPGAAAVTVAGKIPGFGTAATVTNAVGDSINAGAPRFVNEADRDLKHFEDAQDPGDNTHPDPAVVDRACSAGSSSRFCGAWHREHDSEQSNAAGNAGGGASDPGPDQQTDPDTALYNMCQARARSQAMWDANTKDTSYVHQLCENPASQPNPAGTSSSTTLGGTYGSSITLSSYCGQQSEPGATTPTPGATRGGSNGRNCGRSESPGTDGQCRGVGNRFNGGSAGSVNITYGAVIGFEPFNPGFDPDPK
ncbi:CC_3452 family protein [Geopsychrobacter electrodiphilus]|uniref:CC_3452 family protein n=1 Tax=Geopsychrobacter electrodiphilus TaxID=225196 RepID=UPI0003672588|nr:hypothetical protein [Geopsychrobacter electrodiphilus]